MNLLDALVLKELKVVGNETISALLVFAAANQLKTLEDLAGYSKHKLSLKRTPSSLVEFLKSGQFDSARQLLSEKLDGWQQQGTQVLLRGDANYPTRLLDVASPPLFLFCKGNIDLLQNEKSITVVGTRQNTSLGE